jgi:regulator of protease activity HflC (stomatin/prohibitin superfamily)
MLIITNIRIVSQSNAYVIERLGAYISTWSTGMRFKLPFLDRIAGKVSLKEQVADFDPKPVITKDNVTSVAMEPNSKFSLVFLLLYEIFHIVVYNSVAIVTAKYMYHLV